MSNGNVEVTFGHMDVEAYNMTDYQRAVASSAILVSHLPDRAFTGFDIKPQDFEQLREKLGMNKKPDVRLMRAWVAALLAVGVSIFVSLYNNAVVVAIVLLAVFFTGVVGYAVTLEQRRVKDFEKTS
jgi:Flp pilus assembly protein TadB